MAVRPAGYGPPVPRRLAPGAGVGRGAGAALLQAAALLLAAGAVGSVLVHGLAQPRVAVAFVGLIAVGEAVRVGRPGGREQAPLGAAAALAYALLGPLRGLPTSHGALQVVAVAGAGLTVGWLLRCVLLGSGRAEESPPRVPPPRHTAPPARQHRRPRRAALHRRAFGTLRRLSRSAARRDEAARRLCSVGFAAALFQPLYHTGALDRVPLSGPGYGVLLTVVAALAALCDAVFAAGQQRARTGQRFGAALEEELRALPGIGSAIAATGMLVSLAAGEVGLWALPAFCTPLLLALASFRRAAAIRATYGQTIATLARATDVAGYTVPGHARRVADTACALGRELGMSADELGLLEYAALMHDIGQLSLVEPVPDGATAALPDVEQQRIARLGSEVIRRTGVPAQVAAQVARLADPLYGPDGRVDRSLPLAARIIRVANAHDDLLGPAGRAPVLATLREQSGRAYDARVVEALVGLGPLPSAAAEAGPCGVARLESG
ncbi:HD-GYP domain-containing protein [Kitasatospora sp. NPDC052896]|uniref:HD-GYP domain-containing protein n=1 Tax=Kitasatospora sp. NPDC052896 TaxID=3364061 RepID=UPI0037C788A0